MKNNTIENIIRHVPIVNKHLSSECHTGDTGNDVTEVTAQIFNSLHINNIDIVRLRYGRMVKALACRVEGPGSNLTMGKVSEKVSEKKKKKKKKTSQLSSACMMEVRMTGVLPNS